MALVWLFQRRWVLNRSPRIPQASDEIHCSNWPWFGAGWLRLVWVDFNSIRSDLLFDLPGHRCWNLHRPNLSSALWRRLQMAVDKLQKRQLPRSLFVLHLSHSEGIFWTSHSKFHGAHCLDVEHDGYLRNDWTHWLSCCLHGLEQIQPVFVLKNWQAHWVNEIN